jgi:hypothetical protein
MIDWTITMTTSMFDQWPMCFFIQLLLSMFWSMAMVTYPILSLLMLWSIWMIDQCWFSINHDVSFLIQSFFLWSILLTWLFNVNGNINLWSMAQCMLLLSNYSCQCLIIATLFQMKKKSRVSIFVDCKAYANYAKWIEIWETRNWTHTYTYNYNFSFNFVM